MKFQTTIPRPDLGVLSASGQLKFFWGRSPQGGPLPGPMRVPSSPIPQSPTRYVRKSSSPPPMGEGETVEELNHRPPPVLEGLEGVYNLALCVLVGVGLRRIIMLCYEAPFHPTLQDFTCPQMKRDARNAILQVSLFWALAVVFLPLAHLRSRFPSTARIAGLALQVAFVWVAMSAIGHFMGSPLVRMIAVLNVMTAGLKSLSFWYTWDVEPPSISHYIYFLSVPTLVYEPVYPRTPRIRWGHVARRGAVTVVGLGMCYLLGAQFVFPEVQNWNGSFFLLVLQVAPSFFLAWVSVFFGLFCGFLEFWAEILRYGGDRRFFFDWWNATSGDGFWRRWNRPVHDWCVRHVYTEVLNAGYNKLSATLAVFLASAVVHEIIASGSYHTTLPWFFIAMWGQAPLVFLGRLYRGSRVGNLFVWGLLLWGHTGVEVLYMREYFRNHDSVFCVD